MSLADEIFCLGGNRSGKSELAVNHCVQFAQGIHPVRNGTGKLQRADGSWLIQKQAPVKIRYCAPKWRDGILNVIHTKMKEVIPRHWLRGGNWRKAWSEAEHKLYFENTSTIHFKSGEEDLDTYGGADLDAVYQDERLDYKRFLENQMRLVDRDGFYFAAMTPEMGITWEEDHILTPGVIEFGERSRKVLIDHYFFSLLGNPHISKQAAMKIIAGIKDERLIEAKIYGRFVSLSGLVLPQFNRTKHIIPDFRIPAEWPRVLCGDTHHRTPSAFLWAAWGPDGTVYFYRAKKAKFTVPQWKRYLRAASVGEEFAWWGIDEPGAGDGKDINDKENICRQFNSQADPSNPGLPFVQVPKPPGSFEGGIYRMWDYLLADPVSGKSRFKIFKSLDTDIEYFDGKPEGSLVWEIEHYQYRTETKADEETLREKVRLVNDHLISCARYIIQAGPPVKGAEIKSALEGSWS